MRGKVFFNYRRSDSRSETARLQEHLKRRLPRAEIFMDDNLEGGTDFIKELEGKASGSDVFVRTDRRITATSSPVYVG